MLTRTISGACYVAIVVAFFLLRQLTPYPQTFDILTWFICAYGTFEVARALKAHSLKGSVAISTVFGATFPPVYVVAQYFLPKLGVIIAIDYMVLFAIVYAVYAIIKNQSVKTFGASVLSIFYPAVFILFMLIANGIAGDKGFYAMLLIYVISPLTDTMAYLVGRAIGKHKLCPKVSPNKTIEGAIGGLLGGAIGGVLVWLIFNPVVNFFSPVLLFILVGIFASVLNQAGDLFESYIKRRVGLKDMGKIMPGHGGVMDRVDGMSFASVLICVVFLLV